MNHHLAKAHCLVTWPRRPCYATDPRPRPAIEIRDRVPDPGPGAATIPPVEQLLREGFELGAITVKPARRASLEKG